MTVARPLPLFLLSGLLSLSLASPALAAPKKKPAAAKPAVPAAPAACDDFYEHANFAWLQAHPLPAGAASHSRWDELNKLAEQQARELLARSSATAPGPASVLLADFVASAADTPGLDAGVRAVAQPLLLQIDAMRKPRDLPRVLAALHAAGVPALFHLEALRDAGTGQARTWLLPGGLGLPEAGYYRSPAPELQRALTLYRAHQVELLEFAGLPPEKARAQADLAFAIESTLADAMGADAREAGSIEQISARFPALRLAEFLQAQALAPPLLHVQQPAWFDALGRLLAKPNLPQWQAYLRLQLMQALAPAMARDPRHGWMAALAIVDADARPTATERMAALLRAEGIELLGAAYAENYLGDAAAQRAQAIAEAIRAAMGRAIDRAAWLGEAGKSASRGKLAAMQLAIGQPVEPIAFDGLRFERGNYAANLLALRRWNRDRALARRQDAPWPWPLSQATPTIGYRSAHNQLIVTAAALQPPAFEPRSEASDFGSFGALLAQQMSLAFADYAEADGREPVLRQNAADLAAIELALDALLAQGGADPATQQEFFRAWAAVWARQDDPAALAAAQSQTAFAPARWRVNGPLANTPAFLAAFTCKPGQGMHRAAADQVAIWR